MTVRRKRRYLLIRLGEQLSSQQVAQVVNEKLRNVSIPGELSARSMKVFGITPSFLIIRCPNAQVSNIVESLSLAKSDGLKLELERISGTLKTLKELANSRRSNS